MTSVVEQELKVILSSHLVSDVERACDYLVVLVGSRVRVAGDIDELLAAHHRLTGPRRDTSRLPADQEVIGESHTDRQTTLIVRTGQPVLDPAWTVSGSPWKTWCWPTWAATGPPPRPTLEVQR